MSEVEDAALSGYERDLLRGPSARLVDSAFDRAAARALVQRFRAQTKKRRFFISTAGALLSAATVLVVLQLRPASPRVVYNPPSPAQPSPAQPAAGELALTLGFASDGQGHAYAPGSVLAGRVALAAGACVSGAPGRLCAPRGATLFLPPHHAASKVELWGGAVEAIAIAGNTGFSIHTIHAEASLLDASCYVELDESRSFTSLSVNHGEVQYRSGARPHESYAAPPVIGPMSSLFAGQSVRLGSHLQPLDAARGEAPAPKHAVDAARAHPSSALLAASDLLELSASDLLEQAREERAARRYAEAARHYRKLLQAFPESAEARATLVSLGQLELGQLGQPAAALSSFQTYLTHPGQLRQEAEHGAIQALQKLGRRSEERAAIQAFLARYPKSVQAGALSERLKQI